MKAVPAPAPRRPAPEPGPRAGAAGLQIAVVGGGWAGLAAAVTLVQAGHSVTLFEMAARLGGRARSVDVEGLRLDNGQHILIGAYTETLRLMRAVGVDTAAVLDRRPLAFVDDTGTGLSLPAGAALPAFARGVLAHPGWSLGDKLSLLARSARWALGRFRCAPHCTVADLAEGLSTPLQRELIEPLCVAALNTPAAEASGTVFLRVLRDALFSGSGSSDLLLPRQSLGALLPEPARRWLEASGAQVRSGHRVRAVQALGDRWAVDGLPFDRVVMAAPALEAARLVAAAGPDWAAGARALQYEPIVTLYLRLPGVRLASPMVALTEGGPQSAAQFVFDHGQLQPGGPTDGLLAFVVSGARPWLDRGLPALEAAVMGQALRLAGGTLPEGSRVLQVITEKRATFRCTPESAALRPPMEIAPGLLAAGDHVRGPYPATLEGAVRSGVAAARAVF